MNFSYDTIFPHSHSHVPMTMMSAENVYCHFTIFSLLLLAIPNGFCRLRVHGEKNHTVIAVGNLPARQVLLVVVNNVCTYVWWCLKVWCSYLSSNIYSRFSNMCVHCSILCTDKRFIECVRLLAAQQQCRFFCNSR